MIYDRLEHIRDSTIGIMFEGDLKGERDRRWDIVFCTSAVLSMVIA